MKQIYLTLALLLTFTWATNIHAQKHYKSFVVLGDSYSTFDGYTSPLDNAQWYPADKFQHRNDVTRLEQTWWKLFAEQYGSKLKQNNSFSGSTICYDGYKPGPHDAEESSFLRRSTNLKKADLILIFGATNDSWCRAKVGHYKYANWTETDKETLRPALACMLDGLKTKFPKSRIVFMLNSELRDDVNESIHTICNHYGVDVLVLHDIDKQQSHPSIAGMQTIATQLKDMLNKQ